MKRIAAIAACLSVAFAAKEVNVTALREQYKQQYKDVDFKSNRYHMSTPVPQQIHLALAGKTSDGYSSGINVAFAYESRANCVVNYGFDTSVSLTSPPAVIARYLHEGGFHYNVDLLPLRSNALYYYKVTCDGASTEIMSFKTAVNGNKLDKPFRMNVFGDMGWLGSKQRPVLTPVGGLKEHWSAVPTREVQEEFFNAGKTDMVWLVGDAGYADDAFDTTVVGFKYEHCYDGFMNWMQNISSRVPFHVSVGNHESECHSAECVIDEVLGHRLANFSAYNTRWHMPSKQTGGVLNMWYSWNIGPVHFVSINTETDFAGAGEEHRGDSGIFPAGGFGSKGQYLQWLEDDLKQAYADKKSGKRPFIIAGGHRPSFHPHELEGLFQKYEVDLFFAGHKHTYARSLNSCQPPACNPVNLHNHTTTFVYCGGAGNDETDIIKTGPTSNGTEINFATEELSTGWLTIYNETTLGWELISSFDRRVIDQFHLHAKI